LPILGGEEGYILVIEDEEDVIEITRTALEMAGYEVAYGKDGKGGHAWR